MMILRPRLLPVLFLAASLTACGDDAPSDGVGAIYDGVPPQLEASRIILFVPDLGEDTSETTQQDAKALAAEGVTVIRMAAAPGVDGDLHALAIKEELRSLYSRGLDPRRLALAGRGEGGFIVLRAAALLRDPLLAYIVIDACRDGEALAEFAQTLARTIEGRVLSLRTDAGHAGSCGPVLDAANGAETWEADASADAWTRETLLWAFPDPQG